MDPAARRRRRARSRATHRRRRSRHRSASIRPRVAQKVEAPPGPRALSARRSASGLDLSPEPRARALVLLGDGRVEEQPLLHAFGWIDVWIVADILVDKLCRLGVRICIGNRVRYLRGDLGAQAEIDEFV